MTVAALTWPQAAVFIPVIAGLSLVLTVPVLSIFRTGQTPIGSESRRREGRS